MKTKIIYIILIFSLFISCKKEKIDFKKASKIQKLYAENDYGMFGKIKFIIYSDNSYSCVKSETNPNHEKTEKFNGFFKTKNDTINFFPSDFELNNSTKAIIKNNFVEFIDGEYRLKIEIKKNKLKSKKSLNFDKIKDYAIFTYNEKYDNSNLYFGLNPKFVKAYDLNQNDLVELNKILVNCFIENKGKLLNISNYIKQCIAIKNSKQEIEVWIGCYCKDNYEKNHYKSALIDMCDGGKCNVNLKVNLTKHNYSELNISGS